MRLPHTTRRGRRGFTMVELVVVVAIILILVALLSSAIFKVFAQRKSVKAHTEVTQLTAAVDNFKRQYKVDYMPSLFKLCPNTNDYYNPANGQPATPFDADCLQFLGRMFPRMPLGFQPGGGPGYQYDWATGNGQTYPRGTQWILEGDQCLVFFLGGIPSQVGSTGQYNCLGFATNPANPTLNPTVASNRIQPLYSFDFSRTMVVQHNQMGNFAAPFPSYVDAWDKQPYLYFSSYKTANGYNRYFGQTLSALSPGILSGSDCVSQGAWPYAQIQLQSSTNSWQWTYYRADSNQIISAGQDGQFGQGCAINSFSPLGVGPGPYGFIPAPWPSPPTASANVNQPGWTPDTAGAIYPTGTTGGNDDIANFYPSTLGTANAK